MARAVKPRKIPGQARSKQMVEAIIEATARIMIEEGYGRLTTNRVAELAGVSIGSLYQYFGNKDALVCAVHDRHQNKIRAAMAENFDLPSDITDYEGIRKLIRSVVDAHRIEPELHARVEALRQDGSFPIELAEGALEHITDKLEGVLRKSDKLAIEDARLSAWLLVTMVHSLIHAFERAGAPLNDDQKTEEISQMTFGYISLIPRL